MRSDLSLIPVTAELLPGILSIENDSFSDPWPLRAFSEYVGHERILFLAAVRGGVPGEKPGEVLGFGILGVAADESEVLDIAVSPAARGCGVGDALLGALLRGGKERGAAACYLEVRESNKPAIGLYEKYGFSPVGRRKNYYQKPREDAIVMALALDTEDTHADLSD